MKKAIKSNHIYLPERLMAGYVVIEDEKIVEITENQPKDIEIDDMSEYRLLAGIIDIHNHGFGGWSMTDKAEVSDVVGYAKALTTVGVTTILPTAKEDAFKAIAQAMDTAYEGATIYGMHSEGPFWARGGENTIGENYPLPDLDEAKRLVKKAQGTMKMMAIAPELPKAYEVITYLHEQGIKVACCHSAGYAKDIFEAEKCVKLDIATHLGNGMRGIHHRDVGVLGALLLEENIQYELIADLNHICADMIRIMFKIQPFEKFCLISDSNYMAGLASGVYMRYGREMTSDEHGLIKNSDGRICGSGKWVLYNMGQLVNVLDVDLLEVSKMASLNPARFLNIDDVCGSIEVGKYADIMLMNEQFECQRTYVKGKRIYDAQTQDKTMFYNPLAMEKRVRDI